ncbi:Uncharacterised protein [Achromobacter xylosoxidans]|nr:Uncharacterised protein [Achromobacter xylosoxidans]
MNRPITMPQRTPTQACGLRKIDSRPWVAISNTPITTHSMPAMPVPVAGSRRSRKAPVVESRGPVPRAMG